MSSETEKYAKIIKSPWEFAKECVYTYDPQDSKNPIKKFTPYKYLYVYFMTWIQKRMLAVPKSRRMFLSWATLILYLWDTMFHRGRYTAFVSKREEDADELIERVVFILDQIKEKGLLPPDMIPKYVKTYCLLEFPELNSKIQGFPSGSDQLRMHGFSGIMGDEMAFWPFPEKMYASAIPTIEGGGRFTAISSPAPGLFKQIVQDSLEGNEKSSESREIMNPVQGVKIWQNPGNQFWVFELHYTANPAKRDPKYSELMKRAMPRAQYLQEFELHWDSYAGSPVYPDFDSKSHLVSGTAPHLGLPLIIGMDFGLNTCAVVCQLQMNRLVVLKEFTSSNMGTKRFLEQVLIPGLRLNYPIWGDFRRDYLLFVDPASHQRSQTDETTSAQILAQHGFSPVSGELTWEKRRSAVESFLTSFSKEGANFLIDEANCPMLVAGFTGGYRYPDNALEIEPTRLRPLKNDSSHPHDALQYAASRITLDQMNRRKVHVPNLVYGFGSTKM